MSEGLVALGVSSPHYKTQSGQVWWEIFCFYYVTLPRVTSWSESHVALWVNFRPPVKMFSGGHMT